MRVYLGEKGLDKSRQEAFKKTIPCIHCGAEARIGFVYYEEVSEKWKGAKERPVLFVCDLHENKPHDMWLHDVCAAAVYFCEECLEATAVYNQG